MRRVLLPLLAVGFVLLLLDSCQKSAPPQYTTITDYDGHIYKIIKIGNQYWMMANLRTTHYADGTPLIKGNGSHNPATFSSTAYFNWLSTDSTTLDDLGLYYTWAAVMNGAPSSSSSPSGVQGPCPKGFHVPSVAEYQTLFDFLGGASKAGGLMKGFQYWEGGNAGYDALNACGFTALPAGFITPEQNAGRDGWAYIWTATAVDNATARYIFLQNISPVAVDSSINIQNALSCRCLQN
jgi:uncharacterized protein (TIGR02145 family)